MKYRIGIDVGGTFTDGVLLDNDTHELIDTVKLSTTHAANQGVAKGIVRVLDILIKKNNLDPNDISLIAHGTTEATNALLEGDVKEVGIIACGSGIEGLKVKFDTNITKIKLSKEKFLSTRHTYIHLNSKHPSQLKETILEKIEEFKINGIEVIVACQAFSVDNPELEKFIMQACAEKGVLSTGTHEITKLYGLKMRTLTSVINASILPKMLDTAKMTQECIETSGITAPLMIMRCDGGVMNIEEVKKKPILTMLSGPAAGVCGALMYEKISDGIFLEVGGTSTDISVIKNGRVMIKYAEIGGHKTYINSLDITTVGVAGGSMVRVRNHEIIDVGPRSAHIAALSYVVFTNPEDITLPEVAYINPLNDDPCDYILIRSNQKLFAITVSCAANFLGYVKKGDYAYGNIESATKAFKTLEKELNKDAIKIAEEILEIGCRKCICVIKKFIDEYNLDRENIVLVGGGGGCTSIVPFIAKKMSLNYKIAKNAHIISTIGVALAMVREILERTVVNPTNEDILALKNEAKLSVIKSGALESTVETFVEIDSKKNILRMIATGTTQLQTGNTIDKDITPKELALKLATSFNTNLENIFELGNTKCLYIFLIKKHIKIFGGLFKNQINYIRVIDSKGIIRLQKNNGTIYFLLIEDLNLELLNTLNQNTTYGDGGAQIPDCYILIKNRIIDLSGLNSIEQIHTIASSELSGVNEKEQIIALICKK